MKPNNDTPSIRFVGFTDAWEQREFGEIVSEYVDPVLTPTKGYYRLGIKSHAKGTFHSYVRPGMELGTAQMHRVAANNFIVNITFGWEHAVAITTEDDAGKLVSHRFPQFSFSAGMVPAYFKYLILDEDFRHHLWLASPGGAGRNRVLKISEMLEYKFWVPSQEEQQKISILLTKLDTLITLHQRKYDQLVNIKKSMLEKMFPKNGELVPEVRFAGFTDAWEQREFGTDLISIQTGTNKLGSSQGKGTPLLKMGNIQRGYFSLDKIEYLSESDQVEPDNIANYGDFFFNTRNTLELVGKGATWIGESGKYAFNSNIARFKFKDLDTIFFNYLYNTASMIEQVHARAMGTTSVAAIYPQSLKSIEYNVPSMDEQRVIGRFLLEIDTLITLHQRKLERLQNIKKACLEKMFV